MAQVRREPEAIGVTTQGNQADLDEALPAARGAAPGWGAMPVAERADRFAETITQEVGTQVSINGALQLKAIQR